MKRKCEKMLKYLRIEHLYKSFFQIYENMLLCEPKSVSYIQEMEYVDNIIDVNCANEMFVGKLVIFHELSYTIVNYNNPLFVSYTYITNKVTH